jgi:UDP-glucuronate 4-epimerase
MGHYLVTGAAGFIASRVVELLLDEGHAVTGLDDLNDAYDVRLKHWRLARLEGRSRFRFHRLDITERPALESLFRQAAGEAGGAPFDAVFNLAARAGVRQSVANPWLYYETNVTGTLNLLELGRAHGIPKFILASTSSIYGQSEIMPSREDQETSLPLSPYTASKKAAETLCHTYHYLYGLDVTIFRYFTVYGPAGRPDMSLFRFVQWIAEGRPVRVFGDGRQSRDFTYVDDIARGTVAGLRPLGYEIINLGSDTPVVLMDAIHLVEELVGRRANLVYDERHPADTRASWADIGRAERLLGWRPRTNFHEGIEALVGWYRDNQSWTKDIETQ